MRIDNKKPKWITIGGFWECRTRLKYKYEGKNRGGGGKNPMTTDGSETS